MCTQGHFWLVFTVILTTLNNTRQCFYQSKTVDSFWPVNVLTTRKAWFDSVSLLSALYLGKFFNILADFDSCSHRRVKSRKSSKRFKNIFIHQKISVLSLFKLQTSSGYFSRVSVWVQQNVVEYESMSKVKTWTSKILNVSKFMKCLNEFYIYVKKGPSIYVIFCRSRLFHKAKWVT